MEYDLSSSSSVSEREQQQQQYYSNESENEEYTNYEENEYKEHQKNVSKERKLEKFENENIRNNVTFMDSWTSRFLNSKDELTSPYVSDSFRTSFYNKHVLEYLETKKIEIFEENKDPKINPETLKFHIIEDLNLDKRYIYKLDEYISEISSTKKGKKYVLISKFSKSKKLPNSPNFLVFILKNIIESYYKDIVDGFTSKKQEETQIYQNIEQLLKDLKEKGKKLFFENVVSNNIENQ